MGYDGIDKSGEFSKSITDEIVLMNTNRIFYMAIIAMPVNLIHIILFLLKSPSSGQEAAWRMGIIAAHSVMFVLMAVLGGLCFRLRKKAEPNRVMVSLQYGMAVFALIISAAIVAIDQLVTSNVTPFLVACVVIGTILLLRPLYSMLIFIAGYFMYFYALGFTQIDPSILLSNRVNGITASGIGICLSIILWKNNVVTLQQRRFIERQQKELEEKNKQLENLAAYDSLTGLSNRRHFEETIISEISRMRRYGNKESCLLILDLDDFKMVNDSFGHPVGDKLLKSVASLLTTQVRESDLVSRLGGEEFAVLLTNTSMEQGLFVAEKIRRSIESHTFRIDAHQLNITASIGVARICSQIDCFEDSYRQADRALYCAKAKGKNRVERCCRFDVPLVVN